MDCDDFIITVYCLVCEHYAIIQASYPLRRGLESSRPDEQNSPAHAHYQARDRLLSRLA